MLNLTNHDQCLTASPSTLTTRMMCGVSAAALGIVPTPLERAAGRLMRAPDHPSGEGGEGGEGAGGGDGAGAGAGGEGGEGGDSGGTGGAGEGGSGEGRGGEGGGSGEGEGSIAGDAGKGKDGGEGGEGAGNELLGAPEAYEVKVPEAVAAHGVEFDKEVFDLVEPELRELNLSNAGAQKLVDAYATKVVPALVARGEKQAVAASETRAAEIRKEWADAAKADPQIGGAKFDQTVDACAQVWDKFGIKAEGETAGFRKLLNDSGLGNHPDMLRFLVRVAAVTGEGSTIPPDGGSKDTRPIWDRVYGTPDQPAGSR